MHVYLHQRPVQDVCSSIIHNSQNLKTNVHQEYIWYVHITEYHTAMRMTIYFSMQQYEQISFLKG